MSSVKIVTNSVMVKGVGKVTPKYLSIIQYNNDGRKERLEKVVRFTKNFKTDVHPMENTIIRVTQNFLSITVHR